MTDNAEHAAGAAMTEDAALAQASGFAEAAADGQDTAPAAPSRGPHATETRRLYAADWTAFVAWCRAQGRATLPATPGTVAAYLGPLSATLTPNTLARRAAADRHRCAGHAPPGIGP